MEWEWEWKVWSGVNLELLGSWDGSGDLVIIAIDLSQANQA